MKSLTHRREEREAQARSQGVDARLATERLAEATAAMRHAEAVVANAFELKRDAERMCAAAGIEAMVGMNRELTGAWRASEDSDLPAVLR